MYSKLLKLILLMASIGWGISILFVLLPWSVTTAVLNGLGAGTIPSDPMLNYWMRMAGSFSLMRAISASLRALALARNCARPRPCGVSVAGLAAKPAPMM